MVIYAKVDKRLTGKSCGKKQGADPYTLVINYIRTKLNRVFKAGYSFLSVESENQIGLFRHYLI